MKNLSLIFTIFLMTIFFTGYGYSQDLIYLKSDTISAKILEYGIKVLKYQESEMPIKEIKKNKVLRLEYSNGTIEDFGSKNPRKIRPISIGILISDYLFEEMFLVELELNYFYTPYLAQGINIGIDVNGNCFATTGPKYYLNKIHSDKRLTPYIGCQIGTAFWIAEIKSAGLVLQVPFGLDYITKKGYNFALEFSPRLLTNYADGLFLIGLKFGKCF